MARAKLTQGLVNGVKAPDPSGKQVFIWDIELRGFGLLISGTSNAKSYVFQGQVAAGTRKRVMLGASNVLTCEEARKRARDKAREMEGGIDPTDLERAPCAKEQARSITFGEALERMIAANAELRPRTIEEYRGLAQRYMSDLRDLPLCDFTPELLQQRRDKVVSDISARFADRLRLAAAPAEAAALRRLESRCRTAA